ncbi:hypothetical protein FQR65_LT18650 [Abscondita terminalis]|nr:hypothetical protein FQR65_LT18650 [Abscondita terminalis]
MEVAIVGAGISGLLSLRYGIESGMECECYEESGSFGGTWVYTSETDIDKNGFPIYNNMYENLLTTLPKELMTFTDFPYPQHINHSHLTCSDVFNYLSNYVHHFDLENHIRVQFWLRVYQGDFNLPTREVMQNDLENYVAVLNKNGW